MSYLHKSAPIPKTKLSTHQHINIYLIQPILGLLSLVAPASSSPYHNFLFLALETNVSSCPAYLSLLVCQYYIRGAKHEW